MPSPTTLHDLIARVAYEEWEKDGRPDGRDDHYWHLAEERIAGHSLGVSQSPSAGFLRKVRNLFSVRVGTTEHIPTFVQIMLLPMLAGLLYFVGWLYLYYFFFRFGVDILTVDVPTYNVFVYSLPVLRYVTLSHPIAAITSVFLLIAFFVVLWLRKRFILTYIGCVAITLFIVGRLVALEAASAAASTVQRKPSQLIELVMKSPTDPAYDPYMMAAQNMDPEFGVPILLLQTDDQYFIYVKTKHRIRNPPKLIQIGRSDVLIAKTRSP